MINNETMAYQELANVVLDFVKDREFDKSFCKCVIYEGMVENECWLEYQSKVDDQSMGWSSDDYSAADASKYLRSHFLKLTGDRIWGLTFTLYPNGKFEIKYDYNKPENYKETDEVITGEEINATFLK